MQEIFNNGQALLLKKPHKLWLLIINIVIIIFLLLTYMIKTTIFDNYQTKGYIICENDCYIRVAIPSNIAFKEIKLNNKKIDYEIINQELRLDEENLLTYLDLTIKLQEKLTDGEIINLNFYYNKQRIIFKLKDKMF